MRVFVLALAMLAWVAPSWHICELGGHVMGDCGMTSESASHHQGFPLAAGSENGSGPRAFICYCPPRPHEDGPKSKFALTSAAHSDDHGTCLAMLLQGMPALVSHSAPHTAVLVSRPVLYQARSFSFTPRQILNLRGRAPPVDL